MDGETGGLALSSADEAPLGSVIIASDEDERQRLDALAAHHPDSLVDDPELKQLVDFAAQLCGAPIALVSLVEAERQRFLARTGLEATETPRSMSFCQHAMRCEEIYEVRDAPSDPRFAHNPLVTGPPHIRFYAGARLVSDEGEGLGALCVIDTTPRPDGLTDLQKEGLTVLSRAVIRRLNDRRVARESEGAFEALRDSEQRFEALADSIPAMAWSCDASGKADYFNARWYQYTGRDLDRSHGEKWIEAIHPDDREMVAASWMATVAAGQPYEREYRVRRHDGEFRWAMVQAMPVFDDDGAAVRWFGTTTDIHDRRLGEEQRDLLSREMSHRIKNIFSLVGGLLNFEARGRPELKPLTDPIRDRLAALGRAHDYVRDDEGHSRPTRLKDLLGDLFAAYQDGGTPRVRVSGDETSLSSRAATSLALVFHELATNAVKYGALASDSGHVETHIAVNADSLEIAWREIGGPARDGNEAPGFGSSLIDMTIERQLRGTIERGWDDGFTAVIRVPRASLA
jgi:PAS domain S-box-containing protein